MPTDYVLIVDTNGAIRRLTERQWRTLRQIIANGEGSSIDFSIHGSAVGPLIADVRNYDADMAENDIKKDRARRENASA